MVRDSRCQLYDLKTQKGILLLQWAQIWKPPNLSGRYINQTYIEWNASVSDLVLLVKFNSSFES